jgi:uncharacterized repeat protein (TIGR03847 family)
MSSTDMIPEVFTADFTGTPGERTFFVQSRGDWGSLTYLVEKQQVIALGASLRDLLLLVDASDPIANATPARDARLALESPIEPEWRIGTIGLNYEEESDKVVVSVEPVEEEEDEALPRSETVRFLLSRDQARSFIQHALAIVTEGRETCPLCGLPMSPAGHQCPAGNGHHLIA